MGLGCVQGGVEYFLKQKRGFVTQQGAVPIMPGAGLYDLGIGDAGAFPSHADGLTACKSAGVEFGRGNVGAGTGAVVGKIHGHGNATKGGLGSAGWETEDGLKVGAIAAVNAFGDVVNSGSGLIVAGARKEDGSALDSASALIDGDLRPIQFGSNTTLCVIATNAKLTKAQASIVARIAQAGIARAISPCHTQYDGDMVFALSMGEHESNLNRVGVLASKVIEAAILDAVMQAESVHGVPNASELGWTERGMS